MNLKAFFISFSLLSFVASATQAQDVLYKKDGTNEDVKIKEISVKTVTYKRWDNQEGPDFVVPKAEVKSILFENGSEEKFGRDDMLHPVRKDNSIYGKNILSVSPIWMTNSSAMGVGLAYERMLDKRNIISIYIPVGFSFLIKNNADYYYSIYSYGNDRKSNTFSAYPGVKFYPASRPDGRVKYGVGVSIAFIGGKITQEGTNYNSMTQLYVPFTMTNNFFLMGAMVWNSLNFQPTEKIYIGLDFGLGYPYFVNESPTYSSDYVSTPYSNGEPLVNFNFKIGYRF